LSIGDLNPYMHNKNQRNFLAFYHIFSCLLPHPSLPRRGRGRPKLSS